jgi:pimeloyl-ACP methyl ester carboxylesterase
MTTVGKFSLSLVALVLLSVLGACAAQAPQEEEAPPSAAPVYEPVDCKLFGSVSAQAECGYLVVPEDRAQPHSGTVRLAAAVIPGGSDNRKPDPLVFLSGGPGAVAVASAGHIHGMLGAILRDRDLVTLDQRGVGLSEPALDCPEYEQASTDTYGAGVSREVSRERMFEALRACRDRLTEEGANLSAYTSAAIAADVHDLMEALGYDRYNVYGGSYGARLALTIMRDYPDEVRSAVLDSVGPPHEDIFELRALGAQRALERVFEQCAASETCNEKHPNLEETFTSLLEKLDEEPLPVSVRGTTYQVGGGEFVWLILMGMFEPAGVAGLPDLIDGVAGGETSWLPAQVGMVLALQGILWEGMHFSIWCADEVPFNSAADADEINGDLHPAIVQGLEADNLPWIAQLCEMWGAAASAAVEDEPVRVDVPTLILTGEFDPVTPQEFASSTAENLAKAQAFMIPSQAHDVLSSSACARDIMKQFLDAPEEMPDTGCLDKLKPRF